MEYQEPSPINDPQGKQPIAQDSRPDGPQQSRRAAALRRRDRSAKDSPGFHGWVDANTKRNFPEEASTARVADVVASPAANLGNRSEISLRIDKLYRIRVARAADQTHVSGELHLVPWDQYKDVVKGLVAAIAQLLDVAPEKIGNEADIAARPDGTAHPSFHLTIPREVTDDEQRALDVTYSAFNQTLRGQDPELAKDLFAAANPEAVAAGRLAAEDVRRKAGGRSLPQPLTVTTSGKPVTLAGRIGAHPDPERDEPETPMSGKVISIMTEEHKLEIRCFAYKGKKGEPIKSASGKRFTINYSDKEHKEAVLELPLGRQELVTFNVIPRVGRNKDKLMLKSINDWRAPADEAGQSNATP